MFIPLSTYLPPMSQSSTQRDAMKRLPSVSLIVSILFMGACTSPGSSPGAPSGPNPVSQAVRDKIERAAANQAQVDEWRLRKSADEAARMEQQQRPERERLAALQVVAEAEQLAEEEALRVDARRVWWDNFQPGKVILGLGGSLYSSHEGEVELSGFMGGSPVIGSLNSGNVARLGGGVSVDYFLSSKSAIRFGYEHRQHEPEDEAFDGGVLEFDKAGVAEFSLGIRYFPEVFFNRLVRKDDRLRPFVGADLNYMPEFKVEGTADLTGSSLEIVGGDYCTGSLSFGLVTLIGDSLIFELGAEYDIPLSDSMGTATFSDGGGDPLFFDAEADTQDLHVFFRMGWFW